MYQGRKFSRIINILSLFALTFNHIAPVTIAVANAESMEQIVSLESDKEFETTESKDSTYESSSEKEIEDSESEESSEESENKTEIEEPEITHPTEDLNDDKNVESSESKKIDETIEDPEADEQSVDSESDERTEGPESEDVNQGISLLSQSNWNITNIGDLDDSPEKTREKALAESLVGSGIVINNIKYTGNNRSAGTFNTENNVIGFKEGIVLSTGKVQDVKGPNQLSNTGSRNNLSGDSDLNSLVSANTYDATILEFDFVPTNDELTFEYVFSSDEYNEYVNSSFNDVFGFFVNGKNVALLPNTDTPVSINTVNEGNPIGEEASNSQYYRNNDDGNIDTEMDGLTTVLPIKVKVKPFQYNRIKLAIADVGDALYDSNVFISGSSFVGQASLISGLGAMENIRSMESLYAENTIGVPQADPIDTATGSQVLNNKMFELNTITPLDYIITYNSLLLDEGVMGAGWTHNFEKSLDENDDGLVIINWDSNKRNVFVNVDGEYVSPDASTRLDKLIKNDDGSFTLNRKSKEKYEFDSDGLLKKYYDKHGQHLEYIYDASGNLIEVLEPISEQKLNFNYNDNGLLIEVSDNFDRKVTYDYNEDHLVTKITDLSGKSFNYTYNDMNQIQRSTDDKGTLLFENMFDEQGRIIAQKNSKNVVGYFKYEEDIEEGKLVTTYTNREGSTSTYKYNNKYQLLRETDELGYSEDYTYDEYDHLIKMKNANGHITQFAYDKDGNLTKITDALGRTTTFSYDSTGNLNTFTHADGKQEKLVYDSKHNLTQYIDTTGNIYDFEYNQDGLLIESVLPGDQKTTYGYEKGLLKTEINAVDEKLTYGYDTIGRMKNISLDDAVIYEFAYDQADNLVKVVDGLENKYTFTYDNYNQLVSVVDPNGNKTTYIYDTNGNVINEIDPLGNATLLTYDVEDKLVEITDAKGHSTKLNYDKTGRLNRITDPLGNSQNIQYDPVGNILSLLDANGETIFSSVYNAVDNPIEVLNGLGQKHAYEYDSMDRVTKMTNPQDKSTSYTYDAMDRLVATTNPLSESAEQVLDPASNITERKDTNDNLINYKYDAVGRLISEISPTSNEIKYFYNGKGRLNKITNARGQDNEFVYDAAGRVIELKTEEDTTTFEYDNKGNILKITDSTGTISREYDSLDRVTNYKDSDGNELRYEYDVVGNLSALTYPGEKVVKYNYDEGNRLIKVTDWADRTTLYEYDKNNNLTKTTRPNGSILSQTYNNIGQLLEIKDETPNGEVISGVSLEYDELGNLIKETTLESDIKIASDEFVMTYTADNQLATFNGEEAIFDEDGNMISGPLKDQTSNFEYDSRNRLIKVDDVRYLYDAENNRVGINDDEEETSFVLNTNALLPTILQEKRADETINYVYGVGLIGHENADGTYYTYHYDLRGSTVAITDNDSSVVEEHQYGPFGELLSLESEASTPFLYGGKYGIYTDNNGLYHMRARYYNPTIKRFLNKDIIDGDIVHDQSLNRYIYVRGNPITFIDADGNIPVPVITGIVGGIGGGVSTYISDVIGNHGDVGWSWAMLKPTSSWKEYGASVTAGTIGGVALGFGVPPVAAGAITGGTETFINEVWEEEKSLREVSVGNIAVGAIDGAFREFLFGKIGDGLDKIGEKAIPKVLPNYKLANSNSNQYENILEAFEKGTLQKFGKSTGEHIKGTGITIGRGILDEIKGSIPEHIFDTFIDIIFNNSTRPNLNMVK